MHRVRAAAVCGLAALAWGLPPPEGLSDEAWHLLVVFVAGIAALLVDAAPVLPTAVAMVGVAVLTGTLDPAKAFAGYGDPTVLLVVMAFLIARAVVASGLGERLALLVVRRVGGSSLGLGYGLVAVDLVIAPAFPSNTSRSGVLFPVTESLALANGSRPDDATRDRLGSYLMINGMAGLSVSSCLWLTAMAANPLAAELAAAQGVQITFGSWVLAASLPVLVLAALLPWLVHRMTRPTLQRTPQAPAAAARALAARGPLTRDERITAAVFAGLVLGWSAGGLVGLDRTAIAFVGLVVLLVAGVLTPTMLATEGEALQVWLWFGGLFALSTALNTLGVTTWLGEGVAARLDGASVPLALLALVVGYVLLHYLFVSQTAHVAALYGVFLAVGVTLGVPVVLLAYLLAFASNLFSCITPQASSGNLLFVGAGYVEVSTVYRYGAAITSVNVLVLLLVGAPWILLVT